MLCSIDPITLSNSVCIALALICMAFSTSRYNHKVVFVIAFFITELGSSVNETRNCTRVLRQSLDWRVTYHFPIRLYRLFVYHHTRTSLLQALLLVHCPDFDSATCLQPFIANTKIRNPQSESIATFNKFHKLERSTSILHLHMFCFWQVYCLATWAGNNQEISPHFIKHNVPKTLRFAKKISSLKFLHNFEQPCSQKMPKPITECNW